MSRKCLWSSIVNVEAQNEGSNWMSTWAGLGIARELCHALQSDGMHLPTDAQQYLMDRSSGVLSIPDDTQLEYPPEYLLKRHLKNDFLFQAKSGSGKSLSILLTALETIDPLLRWSWDTLSLSRIKLNNGAACGISNKDPTSEGFLIKGSSLEAGAMLLEEKGHRNLVSDVKKWLAYLDIRRKLALEANFRGPQAIQCVIIVPTREMAQQLYIDMRRIAKILKTNSHLDLHVTSTIGGIEIKQELSKLRMTRCHILISTPGRLLSLLADFSARAGGNTLNRSYNAATCRKLRDVFVPPPKELMRCLILDEADALVVNDNFRGQIYRVKSWMCSSRTRICGFSATYPLIALQFWDNYLCSEGVSEPLIHSDMEFLNAKGAQSHAESNTDLCINLRVILIAHGNVATLTNSDINSFVSPFLSDKPCDSSGWCSVYAKNEYSETWGPLPIYHIKRPIDRFMKCSSVITEGTGFIPIDREVSAGTKNVVVEATETPLLQSLDFYRYLVKIGGDGNNYYSDDVSWWQQVKKYKYIALNLALLQIKYRQTMIFCNKPLWGTELAQSLSYLGYNVATCSSRYSQYRRTEAVKAVKKGDAQIFIMTDLGARGLDFPEVDLVVHLDLPYSLEVWLHRCGRGSRLGRRGTILAIVTKAETDELQYFVTKTGCKVWDLRLKT